MANGIYGQEDIEVELVDFGIEEPHPKLDENLVREQAYYRWLDATNGQPVSQEETDKFWLETEDWLKCLKSDQ